MTKMELTHFAMKLFISYCLCQMMNKEFGGSVSQERNKGVWTDHCYRRPISITFQVRDEQKQRKNFEVSDLDQSVSPRLTQI